MIHCFFQSQLLNVDQNVEKLINSIETLRPLYIQAKEALNSFENQTQKNNLVFHGIKPDKLEVNTSFIIGLMGLTDPKPSGIKLEILFLSGSKNC